MPSRLDELMARPMTDELFAEIEQRADDALEHGGHRIEKGEFVRMAADVLGEVKLLCKYVRKLKAEVRKLQGIIGLDEEPAEATAAAK